MTPQEQETKLRVFERRLEVAIAAYRQVWESWQGLDAHSVDQCRRAAMSAALGASDELAR